MQALVEMVREFGIVPADKILDKHGYKAIYNQALIGMVQKRIDKFNAGILDITDFTIKGAVPFLRALKARGVTLYLASGTDHEDVVKEAKVLGYADLFEGGIYGATGDAEKCSKKQVIADIIARHNLEGPQLAVFGDGPVELRQCRNRDGIAVGVASDEIRRHGLNPEKRTRLTKAGAHIVTPDFAQTDSLLNLLFP
jgi:phosphoglycolate phosphatase-like HAD superfamily hydrolase